MLPYIAYMDPMGYTFFVEVPQFLTDDPRPLFGGLFQHCRADQPGERFLRGLFQTWEKVWGPSPQWGAAAVILMGILSGTLTQVWKLAHLVR